MKTIILLCAISAAFVQEISAATFNESTVTEIIKDVKILPSSGGDAAAATVSEVVKAPDRIRTGAESRAELTAPDQTITRVGANTVFAFESNQRTLNLEKGSLLFHSPAGKGGGTIKTAGASAAVLGTTIIVAATTDGGFKFIVLEGKGKATLPDGGSVTLNAGQMVYVLPQKKGFSKILDINLSKLTGGSQLLNGFTHELPSRPAINTAVQKQNRDIAKGKAKDTGISADQFAKGPRIGNGLDVVDNNSYKMAVHTPLTPAQIRQLLGGTNPQGVPIGPRGGPGGSGLVPVKPPPPLKP